MQSIFKFLQLSKKYPLKQRSPTFLAPGTGFVEDNFTQTGVGGGNASNGERQLKLPSPARRSPPAVRPGSQQAVDPHRSAARGLGTPAIKVLHSFPTAAVTNNYKLGGLKHKFILLTFWRSEAQKSVSPGGSQNCSLQRF